MCLWGTCEYLFSYKSFNLLIRLFWMSVVLANLENDDMCSMSKDHTLILQSEQNRINFFLNWRIWLATTLIGKLLSNEMEISHLIGFHQHTFLKIFFIHFLHSYTFCNFGNSLSECHLICFERFLSRLIVFFAIVLMFAMMVFFHLFFYGLHPF